MESEEKAPVPKIAWLAGAAVLLIIAGIVNEAAKARRLDAARGQVTALCNRLSASKDAVGRWTVPPPNPALSEKDPWGNPLRVRYEATKNTARLIVSSDGPDGRQWTADDITVEDSIRDWVAIGKDAAGTIQDVAGAATKGLVGGAIEGVTDHLPKKLREKWDIPSSGDEPKKEEKK